MIVTAFASNGSARAWSRNCTANSASLRSNAASARCALVASLAVVAGGCLLQPESRTRPRTRTDEKERKRRMVESCSLGAGSRRSKEKTGWNAGGKRVRCKPGSSAQVGRNRRNGLFEGANPVLDLLHRVLVQRAHAVALGDAFQLGLSAFLLIASTSSSLVTISSWMPTRPL